MLADSWAARFERSLWYGDAKSLRCRFFFFFSSRRRHTRSDRDWSSDVCSSDLALEEARRRTAQVLANVATGVIALDDGLRVTMANPRAAELLGAPLTPGDLLPRAAPAEWLVVWNAVREFLDGVPEGIVEREFAVGGRQIRVQLASLGPAPDGCVVALDDATALTRAARVLAWGEMARQVAHEIKNPLTPIRLGIQHLQRAREKEDGKVFDATLDETAGRILAEIDRLDAIARAFSRFASPAAEALPLEPVDVYAVAREVVHLYTLGGVEVGARVEIAGDPAGAGRSTSPASWATGRRSPSRFRALRRPPSGDRAHPRPWRNSRSFAILVPGGASHFREEHRADLGDRHRARGPGGRRDGAGRGAGAHFRRAADRDGRPHAGPLGQSRALQPRLPRGARSGRPAWPAPGDDPDSAGHHPVPARSPPPLRGSGLPPRLGGVQSDPGGQHAAQPPGLPRGEEGSDAHERRRVRHRQE